MNARAQPSSLELARFTTELLELRIKTLSEKGVEYAHSGVVGVGREEFENWCAGVGSPIRITALVLSNTVRLFASSLSPEEAGNRKVEIGPFRDAFRRDTERRGLTNVRFLMDRGSAPLDSSAFFRWLDTYDLGRLGSIAGTWRREANQKEVQWTFVITRRIVHLIGNNMQPRRPSLWTRLVGRVLRHVLAPWFPHRTGVLAGKITALGSRLRRTRGEPSEDSDDGDNRSDTPPDMPSGDMPPPRR